MYTGLKHLHSFLPYLLIVLLLISPVVFLIKKSRGRNFGKSDKRLALFTLILAHLQLVVGLILYFVSPLVKAAYNSGSLMSDPAHRFVAVEHIATMIIAIVLITVGYSRAKRKDDDNSKFKTLSVFYLLGLLLILLRIPWETWLS